MDVVEKAVRGAGVSGLYAAWLLQQRGMTDWLLIEGRAAVGGRILSEPAADAGAALNPASKTNRFDLGPSWFWPGYQHQLDQLVLDLGLPDGDGLALLPALQTVGACCSLSHGESHACHSPPRTAPLCAAVPSVGWRRSP